MRIKKPLPPLAGNIPWPLVAVVLLLAALIVGLAIGAKQHPPAPAPAPVAPPPRALEPVAAPLPEPAVAPLPMPAITPLLESAVAPLPKPAAPPTISPTPIVKPADPPPEISYPQRRGIFGRRRG